MEGISAVICCHNGAERLPTTLAHLKAQQAQGTPWSLLIIDNASTDGTADTARSCWQDGPVPLRIVEERRLGVRFARERGFAEAGYPIVAFIDDDNWVAPDWIEKANEIISCDSTLGAVGSVREAVCEVPPPVWFDRYHSSYAILTEQELKVLTRPPSFLPTAGLCVRKSAWETLVHRGFHPYVPSRIGRNLHGGEDTELTVALRLSGWRLCIDPRLRLKHFMPGVRLSWSYLRRMLRASGASDVWLDAYSDNSLSMKAGPRRWVSDNWWYQLARTELELARRPRSVVAALGSTTEGRYDVIEIERLFGRMLGLLQSRRRYGAARRMVREAPWRRLRGPDKTPIGADAA